MVSFQPAFAIKNAHLDVPYVPQVRGWQGKAKLQMPYMGSVQAAGSMGLLQLH